jgi:5-methylthioadenosine/S-adenosylhomocysteine deaminase
MTQLLLTNAQILLPDYTIGHGSVLVNEFGHIEQVHTDSNCSPQNVLDVKVVDLEGDLLAPGFVNGHTHSAMTVFSSAADDLPLQEWLTQQIFPYEAKMTEEQVYWLTKLAILEYLTSGITTAFDMYFHQDASAQAAQDMGFRMVLCGSVNDFGGSAASLEQMYAKYGSDPDALISFRLGIHAEYTTSLVTIREVSELANQLHQPFFTHCSETKREVDECYSRWGKSPVQLFDDEKLFTYAGGIFHGVHLSSNDQEILKRNEVGVIGCPSSNLKLASGIAPLNALDAQGVRVGLGTDGPASNNALSMLREMYLATALQKCVTQDPTALPPERVHNFATRGSAEIIGVNSGVIAPGYLADLVVVDLRTPTTVLNSPLKNLVYSCDRRDIRMTIIGGQILYNCGFEEVDVDEIYAKCRAISTQLLDA